jgi:MFS family permease
MVSYASRPIRVSWLAAEGDRDLSTRIGWLGFLCPICRTFNPASDRHVEGLTLYGAGPSRAGVAGDRRILLANSIYHLNNDGAGTVIAGQITVLREVFAFGAFEIGLITGTAMLVTALFQILFGAMSDRRDPSRFLSLGILVLGVGTIGAAAATSWVTLLAIVALARVGASFYHPVGIAWIGRAFQGESLDRSMGFQSAFGDAGVILGMASAAVLGATLGWQWPFILWGSLNLVAVAAALFLVRGRSARPAAPSERADYVAMLVDVRFWLFPLALGGASFAIFSAFGPPLLQDRFGFSDAAAGVSIAVWILAGAIVAFSFGRVSRRFGRFRALVASYAFLGIASLLGAVVASEAVVLAAFWTLGSALFVTYPALFAFVSEASHRRLQGAAFGVIFGVQLLGASLGSFVAGTLADLVPSTDVAATIPFFLCAVLAFGGFGYLVAVRGRIANPHKPVPAASGL